MIGFAENITMESGNLDLPDLAKKLVRFLLKQRLALHLRVR